MSPSDRVAVSVLIPTHNRADRLHQTLQSLAELIVPPERRIELVVIANACTDSTPQICKAIAATLPFVLRCVDEPQAGAAHARNRAITEAQGEILAFLDDDVTVDKEWLTGLLEVFDHYPADVVVGRVTLCWEAVAKPAWLTHRSAHLLSCVDYGEAVRELFTAGEAISANLAVRRCVLADVAGFRTNLGRRGSKVLAGEDTQFIAQALKTGHRMFYAPRAAGQHWVYPERLTLEYLGRAARANGLARIQIIGRLGPGRRIKLAVENGMKYFYYMMMEWLSAMAGYQKGRIHHRIRRMTCQGVLKGLVLCHHLTFGYRGRRRSPA
jgi:glycosyltransferase involved in cell wall biosynthesis